MERRLTPDLMLVQITDPTHVSQTLVCPADIPRAYEVPQLLLQRGASLEQFQYRKDLCRCLVDLLQDMLWEAASLDGLLGTETARLE
jgi:hypothetical protein